MLQSSNESNETPIKVNNLYRRSFPICPKCSQTCSKEDNESFVRAFNQVYHYHCFICEECGIPVANNFFTLDQQQKKRNKKLILCETHYLKRSHSTTTAVKCPSCITTNQNSYRYEFRGTNYCRLHYSLIDQTHCSGCDQAILKNFVEHIDFPNQIWHPECYMIYKFWSIKLKPKIPILIENENDLIQFQDNLNHKVTRVWTDLSSFEESSANCISDMLLNVASGAYIEGVRMANQFIMHLDVLFSSLSTLNQKLDDKIDCEKQSNLICKDMVRFFELFTIDATSNTQQLLSLVTNLATNLKYLIRTALSFSLILEQNYHIDTAISDFLNQLSELDSKRVWISGRYWFKDTCTPTITNENNTCHVCHQLIQNTDSCYQSSPYKWHSTCFQCETCSTPLSLITKNAVLLLTSSPSLYCTTCHPNETIPNTITFLYSYQHNLIHLKHYLATISTHLLKETKSPPDLFMPESKRQRSLLCKLIHHQDTNPVKMTMKKRLTISTTPITDTPPTSCVTTESPTNIIESPLVRSKSTIYNLFTDRRARRASILTMNEYGQTAHKYAQMTSLTLSQNFILRHAAIIALHPFVSDHFSLDALIALVEHPPAHTKPSVLWEKISMHFRPRTFRAPLPLVAQRDHDYLVQHRKESNGVTLRDDTPALTACFSKHAFIPLFIKTCIQIILQKDMSVEGVFRKNGNFRQLKTTSETIDRSKPDSISALLEPQNGVQLAALLKRYLHVLPEPLFPCAFHQLFVQCSKEKDEMKRKKQLHLACCLLPKPNRDTMCMVFCCLKWVASFSDTNKMDTSNLARVIAPSVLFEKRSSSTQQALEEINVIETLIHDIDEIAIVPSDLVLLTLHDVNQDMTGLNSKYFITEYQKLLKQLDTTSITKTNDDIGIHKNLFAKKQKRSSWIPGLKNNYM